MMTHQMEEQRRYFEKKLEEERQDIINDVEPQEMIKGLETMQARLAGVQKEREEAKKEMLSTVQRKKILPERIAKLENEID